MSFSDRWWEQIPPEELQALFDEMNASSGDTGIYDFGYSGIDPAAAAVMPNAAIPELTNKGELIPYDIAQEAKQVNLLQDYGALSVDNILTGYAGGGAYDSDAFTPTYDYGEPLNLSGRRKAEATAAAGGYRSVLADLIMNGQMDPAEAEATLYEMATAPDDPSLSDQERQARADLLATLPPSMQVPGANAPMPPSGGTGQLSDVAKARQQWDTERIAKDAFEIWNDLMEDPEFAYQDPTTGMFYAKTPEQAMVKTPQMMAFDKFGIPYPTDSYEDSGRIDEMATASSGMTGAEREAMMEPYLANMQTLGDESAEASGRMMNARSARQELERLMNQSPRAPYDTSQVRLSGRTAENAPTTPQPRPSNPAPWSTLAGYLGGLGGLFSSGTPRPGQQPQQQQPENTEPPGPRPSNPAPWNMLDDYVAQAGSILAPGTPRIGEPPMPGGRSGRSGGGQPLLPPDRAVYTNAAGDVAPYDFGGGGFNPFASYKTLTSQAPHTVGQKDIVKQKGQESKANKARYAAQKKFLASGANDPQIAEIEALGRAIALGRLGRTPFRDVMETRNANSRRMLSGG